MDLIGRDILQDVVLVVSPLLHEFGREFLSNSISKDLPNPNEDTLPETDKTHLKRCHPQKETIVFQPSIFRCELFVSGMIIKNHIRPCQPSLPSHMIHPLPALHLLFDVLVRSHHAL